MYSRPSLFYLELYLNLVLLSFYTFLPYFSDFVSFFVLFLSFKRFILLFSCHLCLPIWQFRDYNTRFLFLLESLTMFRFFYWCICLWEISSQILCPNLKTILKQFFLLSCKRFLHILDINPLLIYKCFLPFCRFLLTFMMVSIEAHFKTVLMKSMYLLFLLSCVLFMSYLRNHTTQGHKELLQCFLLRILYFLLRWLCGFCLLFY